MLAPTGVAALHIKGETIHSFFRFKPNITIQDAYKKGCAIKNTAFYETLDIIIIDEYLETRNENIRPELNEQYKEIEDKLQDSKWY